jgi:hypothetical protein
MTRRRKILLWMLLAAIGMMMEVYFFWSGEVQAILYIIYAVPVMVVNESPFGDDIGVVRAGDHVEAFSEGVKDGE